MDATSTQPKINYFAEKAEPGFGLRAYQNAVLSELPGATFALITLAYIVLSFIGL